jgi:hypothetical protein
LIGFLHSGSPLEKRLIIPDSIRVRAESRCFPSHVSTKGGAISIHSRIDKKEEPFNALAKRDEEYFTGLEGFLRTAKTAWRNPSSHVPRIYIEPQARSLFEVVRILMDSASQRLKEVRLV